MIIGAHVSIAGGIENAIVNAVQLGCETFQVFTKNQNQWREKVFSADALNRYREKLKNSPFNGKPLAAHDSYLINLCANDPVKLEQSRNAFVKEIGRCDQLGIGYLIFHPGSHTGKGEAWGLALIADSLNWSIENSVDAKVMLLLETTAGQGTNLGYSFEQLGAIMDRVADKGRIGVCIDTCHIFAAGYDLRSTDQYERTIGLLDDHIGLSNVKAFHLNDTKKGFGSRVDRHARIGTGLLGAAVFRTLVTDIRFENTPGYLEIPGDEQAFREDVALLKRLRSG